MFCYKFNFGLLPDVFDNFFNKVSNVHRHHTRSQCNFHVRVSRTIYVDKSVKYRGTLLWNQLIFNVQNSPNFNICKKWSLFTWFMNVSCMLQLCIYAHQNASMLISIKFCKLTILSFYSSSNHLYCVSREQLFEWEHINLSHFWIPQTTLQ